MHLDDGEIIGGFPHEYDAWLAPAPATPLHQAIARATGLRLEHSVLVTVETHDGRSWSRQFEARFDDESEPCIFTTPKPHVLGIRVQGIPFAVDVRLPDLGFEIDVTPLTCAASDVAGGRMFLASATEVYAFDGIRLLWETRRVSLDGISQLSYSNGRVTGIATGVGIDSLPFSVDAETGAASGGLENFSTIGST